VKRPRLYEVGFAVLGLVLCCSASTRSEAQDAAALRAQAGNEINQEKQVQLLCKASELEPKNSEYKNLCETRKATLINNDRQALKTALDASDAGQVAKAKRYAKYVSAFDPETHKQAEQLLAKLNGADTSSPAAAATPTATSTPSQSAVLAQAITAYESGNLQAAKAGAQSITDASIKPAANRLLGDIERYSGYVSAGQKYEQAKQYAEAERSYRAALDLNAHVSSDDLASKSQRMHQQIGSASTSSVVATRETPKPAKPAAEVSPQDREKRLLAESSQAMVRNDLETAAREYKQVLDIDPGNVEAKQGLVQITALLSKDPVRLEKTLRAAIIAFYGSHFEDAESGLNRYLGADNGKKKGAAYFYLGATEATLSLLDSPSKRAYRSRAAQDNFKQARSAGYLPVEKYVSGRVLDVWKSSGL
jgi:tetratricopeptide (TPR) repeat protein